MTIEERISLALETYRRLPWVGRTFTLPAEVTCPDCASDDERLAWLLKIIDSGVRSRREEADRAAAARDLLHAQLREDALPPPVKLSEFAQDVQERHKAGQIYVATRFLHELQEHLQELCEQTSAPAGPSESGAPTVHEADELEGLTTAPLPDAVTVLVNDIRQELQRQMEFVAKYGMSPQQAEQYQHGPPCSSLEAEKVLQDLRTHYLDLVKFFQTAQKLGEPGRVSYQDFRPEGEKISCLAPKQLSPEEYQAEQALLQEIPLGEPALCVLSAVMWEDLDEQTRCDILQHGFNDTGAQTGRTPAGGGPNEAALPKPDPVVSEDGVVAYNIPFGKLPATTMVGPALPHPAEAHRISMSVHGSKADPPVVEELLRYDFPDQTSIVIGRRAGVILEGPDTPAPHLKRDPAAEESDQPVVTDEQGQVVPENPCVEVADEYDRAERQFLLNLAARKNWPVGRGALREAQAQFYQQHGHEPDTLHLPVWLWRCWRESAGGTVPPPIHIEGLQVIYPALEFRLE